MARADATRRRAALRFAIACVVTLALAGCAAAPRTFGYANADPMLLFPAAGGADPPRYAYVGQLLGESNLVQAGETEESGLRKAWRWFARYSPDRCQPMRCCILSFCW